MTRRRLCPDGDSAEQFLCDLLLLLLGQHGQYYLHRLERGYVSARRHGWEFKLLGSERQSIQVRAKKNKPLLSGK